MSINIQKAQVDGQITAIPSKSYAHRISICNFLAGKKSFVDCGDFNSKDIQATAKCLTALKNGEKVLDCGESGSTLRFMLPLCACMGGEYRLLGQGRLMQRPNDQLFNAFMQSGVSASQTDEIVISGKLKAGEFAIRGDISSQYVSGLLMALPMLDGDSQIILTTPLASKPYVDITLEVLKSYGIKIKVTENGFYVKGKQKYSGDLVPEGDWSNMSAFLVLGATCGKVSVNGLNTSSVQGDKKIIELLREIGCSLTIDRLKITTKKSRLSSFVFDAQDCPDLVPYVSVLGALADGMSVITNVERLALKESDRILSTLEMLRAFNITASSDGHAIAIYGGTPTAGVIDSFNDHRIVMAAAILSCVCGGTIENERAVEKSYPNFFEHLRAVGGKTSNA